MLRKALIIASIAILGGCASTLNEASEMSGETISESDGKTKLVEVHIGERYDAVMASAAERYRVEPECENRKISLRKQRKAFIYDVCAFTPKNVEYTGAPLSEVVFHFIGRALVRVDVRAEGETELLDKIKGDMQAFYAPLGLDAVQLRQGSYEWTAASEITGVRAGTSASLGNIHVRMLDKTLTDDAPWLAAE